ncbi:MAG: protein kinase [Deltaproteobacteria bacterium]|nr:protein kinase [Deltaproteobacteria bacterium]MBW2415689.1 protein kinase [Deltaproteobacteria bacterium]
MRASDLRRALWNAALVAGAATVLLGLVVILGWYTGNVTLVQVLPNFVPMQYNTALGFVLCGASLVLLALGRSGAAAVSGGVALAIGSLTLVQYAAGVDLGIDELAMKHDITVATSQPGRMAPNTAICFAFMGLAFAIGPLGLSPARRSLARVVLTSLVFGLSLVALSGYLTALETAYGWGNLTRMAVHTSVGFIVVSNGLLWLVWQDDVTGESWIPGWLPVPTAVGVLTAALCLWQALGAQATLIERKFEVETSLSELGVLILIGGILLAFALSLAAHLARRFNEQAKHESNVAQDLVEDASARLQGPLLGVSEAVRALHSEIETLAGTDDPVVLRGPHGATSEAVARALHQGSDRSHRAFIHVNCLAVGGDARMTLFGGRLADTMSGGQPHAKWELAVDGTLYLERVDALQVSAQKELLSRIVEGDEQPRPPVRVVAYASEPLAELAERGGFEPELAARLSARALSVPVLSERIADLPALAEHFLKEKAARMGKVCERLSPASLERLGAHRWPGDVEELQSVIECALIEAEGVELDVDEALLAGAARVGHYRLMEKLGEGGMGEVWRARHEMLRRPAAVKLISGQNVPAGTKARDAAMRRFEREALATAALSSPHTVQLYDFGVSDRGDIYYVMELLEGRDLDSLVQEFGPMPASRCVSFLKQACLSLAEAHESGLVHRDIKPANLFASHLGTQFDYLKVLDFGIVKRSTDSDDMKLTRVNDVVGSPAFMAPEMITEADEIDGRSDLYALGCVAWWLLTGDFVFEAKTATQMCVQHATAEPPPLSERAAGALPLPAGIEDVVMACLRKRPAERPASARALWERLDAIDLDEPWTPADAESWWADHLPELTRG